MAPVVPHALLVLPEPVNPLVRGEHEALFDPPAAVRSVGRRKAAGTGQWLPHQIASPTGIDHAEGSRPVVVTGFEGGREQARPAFLCPNTDARTIFGQRSHGQRGAPVGGIGRDGHVEDAVGDGLHTEGAQAVPYLHAPGKGRHAHARTVCFGSPDTVAQIAVRSDQQDRGRQGRQQDEPYVNLLSFHTISSFT